MMHATIAVTLFIVSYNKSLHTMKRQHAFIGHICSTEKIGICMLAIAPSEKQWDREGLYKLLKSSCFALISLGKTSIIYSKASVGVVLKAPMAANRADLFILGILLRWLFSVEASHQTTTPCRKKWMCYTMSEPQNSGRHQTSSISNRFFETHQVLTFFRIWFPHVWAM